MERQRIRILPPDLVDKIAAGEVIERPASAVRELLENSLDAGADEIVIELKDGGREYISVMDNGCGMSREDALLSLKRHATSKIAFIDDLKLLKTLGFRGEALHSIASVSRFELRTFDGEGGIGTRITVEGGRDEILSEYVMPRGCEVIVADLFFNMPARRKFLKSSQTELSHILELVTRLAICRSRVKFLLKNDGKTLLNFPKTLDIRERMLQVFGKEIFSGLVPLQKAVFPFALSGFISSPQFSSSTASSHYIYVNGRFIPDPTVRRSIMSAYGNLIEKGRYPYAVLFLNFSTPDVDFNVHPQKAEVRFVNSGEVFETVFRCVKDTVTAAQWLGATNEIAILTKKEVTAGFDIEAGRTQELLFKRVPAYPVVKSAVKEESTAQIAFSLVMPLGQYRRCYILGQYQDFLIVIDQHAAHERVNFERMKRDFLLGGIARQGLLLPETVEIPSFLVPVLDENSERLERLGFEIELFSGNSIAIKSCPALLKGGGLAVLVTEMLENLKGAASEAAFSSRLDRLLSTIACHGSIKGGNVLSIEESRALLIEMDEFPESAYCPHGRQAVKIFTSAEVAKWFDR